MATARITSGLGSQTAALAAGGYNGTALTTTEEWSDPTLQIKTLTTS